MANKTDPDAGTAHGTDPQYLIEKILRSKIHDATYWKEHCFGLTGNTCLMLLLLLCCGAAHITDVLLAVVL